MNYSAPPQNIKYISESNSNICRKYNDYIDNYMRNLGRPIRSPGYKIRTPSEYCNFLNHYILSLHYDEKGLNKFINEMIASCKQDIDDFSWLENDRLCYYAWLFTIDNFWIEYEDNVYIDDNRFSMNSSLNSLSSHKFQFVENMIKESSYSIPSSSSSRAKIIKDLIILLENNEKKVTFINKIKFAWETIEKIKIPFNFSIDDIQQINWTWNYILSKVQDKFPYKYSNFKRYIIPTSTEEKYHAIYAIHDYFYANNNDTHKVFCIEYKRALSQKKFREKENTKTINFQIGIEHKEKLDEILNHYQYSQQKFFEMLISDHYKLIKDKLNKSNFS